jgi:hypothetical protein
MGNRQKVTISRKGGRFAPAPWLSAHAASGSIPSRSLTAHRNRCLHPR